MININFLTLHLSGVEEWWSLYYDTLFLPLESSSLRSNGAAGSGSTRFLSWHKWSCSSLFTFALGCFPSEEGGDGREMITISLLLENNARFRDRSYAKANTALSSSFVTIWTFRLHKYLSQKRRRSPWSALKSVNSHRPRHTLSHGWDIERLLMSP